MSNPTFIATEDSITTEMVDNALRTGQAIVRTQNIIGTGVVARTIAAVKEATDSFGYINLAHLEADEDIVSALPQRFSVLIMDGFNSAIPNVRAEALSIASKPGDLADLVIILGAVSSI